MQLKRSGYILIGWTTTKDGTTVLPDKYTATKDITLYAKWVKSYKVTFNAGEGYFGSDTSSKTKVLEIESGKDIGNYPDYSSYPPQRQQDLPRMVQGSRAEDAGQEIRYGHRRHYPLREI